MRLRGLRREIGLAAIVLLTCAGVALAQAPGTGAIKGMVYDPSGLAVQNAQVTIVNASTNVIRSATTTSAGVFTVSLLTPGSYLVSVSAPGFESKSSESAKVVVSETTTIEFQLSVAKVGVNVRVDSNTE